MNTAPSAVINLIELLVAIAILVWFFYNPWQSLLIDIVRQRIFEVRDQLFLYAAEGKIEFDSAEYKKVRDFLNLSIRFCHRFGIGTIIASKISNNKKQKKYSNQIPIFDTIRGIRDYETSRKLESMITEVVTILIFFMILRSLLLLILLVTLIPIVLVYLLYKGHPKQLITTARSIIERDIKMGGV